MTKKIYNCKIGIKKRRYNTIKYNTKNMSFNSKTTCTQNDLLMKNLMEFYKIKENIDKMMSIINGETNISLRIVDWFVTNYAKKNYTVYEIMSQRGEMSRFKVYNDYKLKLKAYAKKRFDPFCRWERISIPYDDEKYMETTIGQLNFFKWAIENKIIEYIKENYSVIEKDMNSRNSTSKNKSTSSTSTNDSGDANFDISGDNDKLSGDVTDYTKTRKKREELSISACKCIKKETVKIVVKFL